MDTMDTAIQELNTGHVDYCSQSPHVVVVVGESRLRAAFRRTGLRNGLHQNALSPTCKKLRSQLLPALDIVGHLGEL
jgi:hypothetical protein